MPKDPSLPHILILGGTGEAYALAEMLGTRADLRLTSSLAGVTTAPKLPTGAHRIGGFGGVEGLAAYLKAENVALLVDASHPFAGRITAHAREAAQGAGIRHVRLERAPWSPGPGDRWTPVADLEAAFAALSGLGAGRVFAALGARAVPRLAQAPFAFVARGIEPPADLPANVSWIGARGPFTLADELALLRGHAIDAVLCRNSGGEGGRAKLEAARTLGLPVVMLERPAPATGEVVAEVAAVLALVEVLVKSARHRLDA